MSKDQTDFKIIYCITCGFKSRAEELRAELDKAFACQIEFVQESGGLFEVECDGQPVFSKLKEERFPEPGEVVNIVTAIRQGKSLTEAQDLAKELLPKPPTFGDWYTRQAGDK